VKVLFKLSGVAAVLAAVVVGVFGVAGSSAASTKASSFTLGIVADTGGLNDHGFNHLAYEGQLEAQKKLGVKIQTLQATSSADYVPYLTKEAEDGDNLVVAVGFDFIDALGSVAKEFPKTKFAIIDTPADAIKGKPKNVEGLTFDSQQSGYLAGYLSGAAKCETIADNQIQAGSKIVFQVAGGCGLGALQAAKQHGDFGIGVDADQGYLGSYILTSALKKVDVAVEQATAQLLKGKFDAGGDLVYSVANDGTGYGALDATGKKYSGQLAKVLAQIKSGKIKVSSAFKG
jgi:basic membrane protein A